VLNHQYPYGYRRLIINSNANFLVRFAQFTVDGLCVGVPHNIADDKASFNYPKNEQQKPLASEPVFLTA
jgi:hypothetical protein